MKLYNGLLFCQWSDSVIERLKARFQQLHLNHWKCKPKRGNILFRQILGGNCLELNIEFLEMYHFQVKYMIGQYFYAYLVFLQKRKYKGEFSWCYTDSDVESNSCETDVGGRVFWPKANILTVCEKLLVFPMLPNTLGCTRASETDMNDKAKAKQSVQPHKVPTRQWLWETNSESLIEVMDNSVFSHFWLVLAGHALLRFGLQIHHLDSAICQFWIRDYMYWNLGPPISLSMHLSIYSCIYSSINLFMHISSYPCIYLCIYLLKKLFHQLWVCRLHAQQEQAARALHGQTYPLTNTCIIITVCILHLLGPLCTAVYVHIWTIQQHLGGNTYYLTVFVFLGID